MLRNAKVLVIALAIFVIAGSAYAFAASNTMPTDADIGYGTTTVSGYTITNVAYDLVDTAPNTTDAVTFTISPTDAVFVQIQIDASGSWEDCTNTTGSVVCALAPAYNVVDIDTFNVIASSSANAVD